MINSCSVLRDQASPRSGLLEHCHRRDSASYSSFSSRDTSRRDAVTARRGAPLGIYVHGIVAFLRVTSKNLRPTKGFKRVVALSEYAFFPIASCTARPSSRAPPPWRMEEYGVE